MSDTSPPTLPSVLWQLANLVFKREAVLMAAAVVVLLGLGGAGVVWAQSQLDGGVAPLRVRIDSEAKANADVHRAQQAEAEDLRRRMAAVERVALETNLNVRLLLEDRRITPVTLEQTDGGR